MTENNSREAGKILIHTRPIKLLFRLALFILAPVVVLMVAEAFFRAVGYGIEPRFVLRDESNGRTVFRDNPDIGKLWFAPDLARSPVPFVVGEKSNQVRVVVIGESAAMGDPAPAYGMAPALASILKHRYTNQAIEVINAAMTAIDSSVLAHIARDLAPLKPDLVLVYMGNNEIVGPFGFSSKPSTSELLFSENIRFASWARSLRFGQWYRDRWHARKPPSEQTWRGLGQFAGREFEPNSVTLRRAHERYRRNLGEIVKVIRSYGAVPVVCTMASRLNWPPFAGAGHKDVSVADAMEANGEWRGAYYLYRQMLDENPDSAEWRYRLGRSLMAMGEPAEAIKLYKQSRDLDRLRFRVDSKMNRMVRDLAEQSVLMIDIETLFDSYWVEPHRFFWDHVHLTPDGNFLAAAKIARELESWFEGRGMKADAPVPGIDQTLQDLLYTELDRLNVSTVMHGRMLQSPLSEVSHHREIVGALTEQIRALRSQITPAFAEKVREILTEESQRRPNDHHLLMRLAKLHEQMGDDDKTRSIYERILQTWPRHRGALQGLGRSLVRSGRIEEGIATLEQAEIKGARRAFAVAKIEASSVLAEIGQYDKAVSLLDDVLARESGYAQAWYNRGIIMNRLEKFSEAEENFNSALRYQPGMASAFNNLGVIALKQERRDDAEHFFLLAVKNDSLLISALRNLAMVNMLKGDWEESLRYSRKLSYLDPEIGESSDARKNQ